MRRKSDLPELLAPAGDFEALLAAVSAGADAVYLGGKAFGARAYAKNFETHEIERAVEYCHLYGVRLYVTVNTLVLDKEMRELSDYAAALWEAGVDALIITDLGAIREIRRRVPRLELHASTQMSVHSADGAKIAAELGCSRVVLARELSYENIKAATEATGIVLDEVKLTGTDSIATTIQKAGYQAMHLFGAEEGRPSLKGSADDVVENVDELILEDNVEYIMELLKQ